jgi:hypothetical protein
MAMKLQELKALTHLLQVCEEYERAKRRLADIPEALRNRALTVGTEQLRLNVAAGSWVRVRAKCPLVTIRELGGVLDNYQLLLDGVRRMASGQLRKEAIVEMAQDLLATVEPPPRISRKKS